MNPLLNQLSQRCGDIAGLLAAAQEKPPKIEVRHPSGGFVITGVGGSKGPATLLCALLQRELEAKARYAPLSEFFQQAPKGDTLVVFSQGLSPNGRIPLSLARRYKQCLVVTSKPRAELIEMCGGGQRNVALIPHPPGDERGFLFRLQGPAVASLRAFQIAYAVAQGRGQSLHSTLPADLGPQYAACLQTSHAPEGRKGAGPWLKKPLALLRVGAADRSTSGLGWKLLEGLLQGPVPTYDPFEWVHGPLQGQWQTGGTIVALAAAGGPATLAPIWSAVEKVCQAAGLRFLPLPSPGWGRGDFFAYDAYLNNLLLEAWAQSPPAGESWPGKGYDGPIYDMDKA